MSLKTHGFFFCNKLKINFLPPFGGEGLREGLMKRIKLIFNIIKPWKWQFAFSSLLLIAGIFIRMLEPKIFQVAIDYVAPMFSNVAVKENTENADFVIKSILHFLPTGKTFMQLLGILVLIYMLISIVRAAFVFTAKAKNADATEKSIELLRNNLFTHIQKLPMSFFSTISTGELIQRSTGDIETIRRFIGNQLVEVIRLLAIFVFSSYWLFEGSIVFGFIAISAVPFIAISSYIFFVREQKIWQLHEDEADKLNAITQENIAGIRIVKAFAQEEQEKEKFDTQNQKKLKVALNHAKLHTVFWPLSDFLVHFQIIISILIGGYFVLQGQFTIGELVSYNTYIVMVAWPLRQVGRTLSEMGMALVAVERLQHILDAPEEAFEKNMQKPNSLHSIEFKNVWFKYPKEEEFALQDVSFKINEGETFVLLGATGSGKSTLVKLLLRFYDIEKGQILINNIPIEQIDKKHLRKKIGMVLQQAFLFTETLAGNMAYANKDVAIQNVMEAATWTSLKEVDAIFTEGYNTMVGEKGVTLSGGQKQRVSLARTLLQNPDILILDDVTSAVDTGTEQEILENIHSKWQNKTKIIISHRLTVVPFASKIIVLEKGKVMAIGTHVEVLKQNKFYKHIHEIQNVLESEIEGIN